MFNRSNDKSFANWFPGQTATRDRWGTALSTEVKGREFQAASSSSSSAAERMRWSLGHA
jgi:hypothetical protein